MKPSTLRKPTGSHPRTVDWTVKVVVVNLMKNPACSYLGVQTVRDGRLIKDGYHHLVLLGAQQRAVYANDQGEVMRLLGQSSRAKSQLQFENPVTTPATSHKLAGELHIVLAAIEGLRGDIKSLQRELLERSFDQPLPAILRNVVPSVIVRRDETGFRTPVIPPTGVTS